MVAFWPSLIETINTLRPRQNGRHFPDDILKCIFVNDDVYISIKISSKFVPKGLINNIPAMVQIMAWRRPGDKPLSGPMMVSLLTNICVTRPQWFNLYRLICLATSNECFAIHLAFTFSANLNINLVEAWMEQVVVSKGVYLIETKWRINALIN